MTILNAIPENVVPMDDLNTSNDGVLKWSGDYPIPGIGAKVKINFNHLGTAVVIGYIVIGGWLGLRVQLDNPPEWFTKQNVTNFVTVFGAEIKEK